MRIAVLALLTACTAAQPQPQPDAAARKRATAAADDLGKTLKTRLIETMKSGGPLAAVTVCSEEASPLTQQVAERHGVRLGRASTQLRNPNNTPPDWVASWLQSASDGGSAEPFFVERDTPGGRVTRHLRPLRVEAPCLACHGSSLSPEVAAHLGEHYPEDRATGYAMGDLRGALWVEVTAGTAPPE